MAVISECHTRWCFKFYLYHDQGTYTSAIRKTWLLSTFWQLHKTTLIWHYKTSLAFEVVLLSLFTWITALVTISEYIGWSTNIHIPMCKNDDFVIYSFKAIISSLSGNWCYYTLLKKFYNCTFKSFTHTCICKTILSSSPPL